jgi:hypothetical protein
MIPRSLLRQGSVVASALLALWVSSSSSFVPAATAFYVAPSSSALSPSPSRTAWGADPLSTTTALFAGWRGGGASTVEAPTKERTEQETRRRRTGRTSRDINEEINEDNGGDYPDLEYLIDSQESREMEDPFHILLLGSTFDKPKISVSYVATSLEYVLAMPGDEAQELSSFAKESGFSCLGTWPREECLDLGKQLQRRDLVCRVVPYCEGGQRGWQAKDASESSSSSSSSESFSSYN